MYETNISDKYTDLNNRIDDAFMELLTQSIGMNGLTRECNELKQELLRLQEEQKSNLLWIRILTGISAGLLKIIIFFAMVYIVNVKVYIGVKLLPPLPGTFWAIP